MTFNNKDFAIASDDIYYNPQDKYKKMKKAGIAVEAVSGDHATKSGFFGALVKKGEQYAIVIRGTDVSLTNLGDLTANHDLLNKILPKEQMQDARAFVQQVKYQTI